MEVFPPVIEMRAPTPLAAPEPTSEPPLLAPSPRPTRAPTLLPAPTLRPAPMLRPAPTLRPAPLPTGNLNSIRVVSTPDGAEIFVNGTLRGKAPVTVGNLPDGTYEVKAIFKGAKPISDTVSLRGAQSAEVRFKFSVLK